MSGLVLALTETGCLTLHVCALQAPGIAYTNSQSRSLSFILVFRKPRGLLVANGHAWPR